jgi:hypothetical protein
VPDLPEQAPKTIVRARRRKAGALTLTALRIHFMVPPL